MIPKSYTEYHRARARRIRELLTVAGHYYTTDSVHDLRVEMKRLRAFHKLVAAISPQPPPPELWRPLRRLFKAAGPLRDLQVQGGMVLDTARSSRGNLSEYLNFVKQREIGVRRRFTRAADSFPHTAVAQLMAGAVAALRPYRAEKVLALTSVRLEKAIDRLMHLRSEAPFDIDTLHRIRILAKEARYTLELLRFQARQDAGYDRLNLALKTVHQTLGRWHDAVVGQQYLDAFLDHHAIKPLFDPRAYDRLRADLKSAADAELTAFDRDWAALKTVVAEQRDSAASR